MQARMHVPKLSYVNKILIISISVLFLLNAVIQMASRSLPESPAFAIRWILF